MSTEPTDKYPRIVVGNKPYLTAQEAAKAFLAMQGKGITGAAVVQTSDTRSFELGGINAAGEKYLNNLSFQSDPIMKAFKEEFKTLKYGKIIEAPAPIKLTPGVDYPRYAIGSQVFTNERDAYNAFMKLPADSNTLDRLVVQTSQTRAFEVAAINANGERYVNKLHFQDHPLMQAFRAEYTSKNGSGIDLNALNNQAVKKERETAHAYG